MHAEWTIKAARAGKHSLVEKPFTVSAEQAAEVDRVVTECGVKVMEAFMWRFHPMHRRVRELIREGAIGPVRNVRAAFTFSITRGPNVRLSEELNGGGLMDVGCYCISESRYLFDSEPIRVYAVADYDPEYRVDMLATVILEFPNGRATFDCGFELPFRCDYEVSGSTGHIVCPLAILPGENAEIFVHTATGSETERFPGINQYVLEFEHVSKCIAEGLPLEFDTGDALKQQKVIDAIYRSTRSGQAEAV
jgi:predicted dehydrogenase